MKRTSYSLLAGLSVFCFGVLMMPPVSAQVPCDDFYWKPVNPTNLWRDPANWVDANLQPKNDWPNGVNDCATIGKIGISDADIYLKALPQPQTITLDSLVVDQRAAADGSNYYVQLESDIDVGQLYVRNGVVLVDDNVEIEVSENFSLNVPSTIIAPIGPVAGLPGVIRVHGTVQNPALAAMNVGGAAGVVNQPQFNIGLEIGDYEFSETATLHTYDTVTFGTHGDIDILPSGRWEIGVSAGVDVSPMVGNNNIISIEGDVTLTDGGLEFFAPTVTFDLPVELVHAETSYNQPVLRVNGVQLVVPSILNTGGRLELFGVQGKSALDTDAYGQMSGAFDPPQLILDNATSNIITVEGPMALHAGSVTFAKDNTKLITDDNMTIYNTHVQMYANSSPVIHNLIAVQDIDVHFSTLHIQTDIDLQEDDEFILVLSEDEFQQGSITFDTITGVPYLGGIYESSVVNQPPYRGLKIKAVDQP